MLWRNKLIIAISKKLNRVKLLSIKTLTFLGFALVAFPLVLALLNSANQVNELSKQGADSIFTVAELINTNQQISNTLKKMERYASQYLVLQDNELKHNYIIEQQKLLATNDKLFQYHDNKIKRLTKQFSQAVLQVHQRIIITDSVLPNNEEPIAIISLEVLQKQFIVKFFLAKMMVLERSVYPREYFCKKYIFIFRTKCFPKEQTNVRVLLAKHISGATQFQ